MSSSSVEKYIGLLMASRNQAHVYHLVTRSYASHKAFEKYYEKIIPLLDSYAETYMGNTRKRIVPHLNSLGMINPNPKYALKYFINLNLKIKKLRLPKNPYLDNIKQEIDALIRQTIYMLSLN